MFARRHLFPLLVACAVALLAYTSFRALRLSFVHDESLSFLIASGDPAWKDSANDHPLNTWLMGWSLRGLGDREWQLRLPNVLAHVLYLACGLVLLRQLSHAAAMAVGFAFLNLNPFLLDFFGLARGYGLALGLSMAALLFLWLSWRADGSAARAVLVLASSACASLADLANYTWLNLHLALLSAGVVVVLLQPDPVRVRATRASLGTTALLIAANGWFIHLVVRRVWALKERGDFYGRGEHGFFADTVGSLVESYFYGQPYANGLKWALAAGAVAAFLFAVVALGHRTWTERRLSFPALLLLVLGLAVAAPLAEHALLGVPYPNERIALYYVPVSGLLVAFAADQALATSRRSLAVAVGSACLLVACGMLVHIARTANLRHTRTWRYDANTKRAMLALGQRFSRAGHPVHIGNAWMFEPTINYYRLAFGYHWLSPATRDRLHRDDNDVVYCHARDVLSGRRYSVAQAYSDTGTVLYVADRPARSR